MDVRVLAGVIREAQEPVAVAVAVCGAGPPSVVSFHDAGRAPLVLVDNLADRSDGERRAFMEGAWRRDHALCAALEHQVLVEDVDGVVVPILHPEQPIGAIRVRCEVGEAATLAMIVATRLAQLGVPPWRPRARARLTTRQRQIAELATRGATNNAIADALAISTNTVKVRLKQVFQRLGVGRRVELASALQHASTRFEAPPGITHRGSITIVIRPDHASWLRRAG